MDDDGVKVLMKFGYRIALCLDINAATQIMKILGKENVLLYETSYKDGVSTPYLKPWGTDEISMHFINPASYLAWTTAGDAL
jgi:hypothetical protein